MTEPDLISLKRDLRQSAKALRQALARRQPEAGKQLAAQAFPPLPLHPSQPGPVVGFYYPLAAEMDALPLVRLLAAHGCTLALPVVVAREAPLLFRRYAFGDLLATGLMNVQQPLADAEPLRPDWLLMPLLAFDRQGRRLGYGGGYYDRTLAALRAAGPVLAIGLAYAGQEVAAVPAGPRDARLDAVATEQAFIQVNGSPGSRHS